MEKHKMNEHTKNGLNFLGLMLGAFGILVLSTDKLVSTKNYLWAGLVLTSLVALFIFGLFSSFEIIKGIRK